jgi:TM2 domain-containing membrane protein YozV
MKFKFRERDLKKEIRTESSKKLPAGSLKRAGKLKKLWEEKAEESSIGRTIRLPDKKSATSLSLLFPGLGQVYMGQKAIGMAFMLSAFGLMALYLFLSGILNIKIFSNELIPAYDFHILLIAPIAMAILSGISIHMAFGLFPELKLTQLITANRKREYYLLSIMFPGYGQLLNVQPKKGIFFSSLSILGVFSFAGIYFTYFVNWYEYTGALGTLYVETALIVMSVVAILSLFFYIVSIFDAFTVRRHPYLKRPPVRRFFQSLGFKSERDKAVFRRSNYAFVAISFLCFLSLSVLVSQPSYRRPL